LIQIAGLNILRFRAAFVIHSSAGFSRICHWPQLTGNTWRKLRFIIPAGKAVECTASISVKSGVVVLVTMSQSTGLKAADAEICDWIKRRWQFNPKLSGTFAMPLVLHPAEATVTTRG
jgi:hypothetical protein